MSLDVVSVTKMFGDFRAVDDLTLSVAHGEFISILGPSGCGKTTTLRMILGLETPTSGEIRVGSKVVTHHSPKEREVGIVFQDYAIFPHLSPKENIAFGLKMARLKQRIIDDEVSEIAKLLRIQEMLQKKTKDLNSAELQQLAIARTLVTKPKVILFDEPLSNLEAFVRMRVRAQLRALQRDLGQTAIFVTHDQAEAMALSDRIAVMNEGRLQQYGTPEQLHVSPKNLFVANFIGGPPMNIIRGHARMVENQLEFKTEAFWKRLNLNRISVAENQAVCLGIRPENIDIVASGGGWFDGLVESVEYLGSETIVSTRIGSSLVKSIAKPGLTPKQGTTIGILPTEKWVRIFDMKTGELLQPHLEVA